MANCDGPSDVISTPAPSEAYICSESAQSLGATYDFNSPFMLKMSISTDPSQSGHGGIFEARGTGSHTRVEIYWTGGELCLQLCQVSSSADFNSCLVRYDCVSANVDQSYAVQVSWENCNTASWQVDGVLQGSWTTVEGFGSDVPVLCYSASGGIHGHGHGWKGSVSSLSFQPLQPSSCSGSTPSLAATYNLAFPSFITLLAAACGSLQMC